MELPNVISALRAVYQQFLIQIPVRGTLLYTSSRNSPPHIVNQRSVFGQDALMVHNLQRASYLTTDVLPSVDLQWHKLRWLLHKVKDLREDLWSEVAPKPCKPCVKEICWHKWRRSPSSWKILTSIFNESEQKLPQWICIGGRAKYPPHRTTVLHGLFELEYHEGHFFTNMQQTMRSSSFYPIEVPLPTSPQNF